MSRSFRNPWIKITDKAGTHFQKRLASKSVRKSLYVSDGANYKKCYDSWNICDRRYYNGDAEVFWKYSNK